jgi:exonuclease III
VLKEHVLQCYMLMNFPRPVVHGSYDKHKIRCGVAIVIPHWMSHYIYEVDRLDGMWMNISLNTKARLKLHIPCIYRPVLGAHARIPNSNSINSAIESEPYQSTINRLNKKINQILNKMSTTEDVFIVGGDFNSVPNGNLDCSPGHHLRSKLFKCTHEQLRIAELVDVFRQFNKNLAGYTRESIDGVSKS